MTGGDKACLNRLVQRTVFFDGFFHIHLRHFIANSSVFSEPFGAAQFIKSFTDNVNPILRAFGIHRHCFAHILNFADDRIKQRRRHGDFCFADGIIIFHAVFAGDAGHAKGGGIIVNRHIRANELRQFVFAVGRFCGLNRIAPAEIIQPRQMIQISAYRHGIADCFVNGASGHVVGVDITVTRADAMRHHHAFHGSKNRPHNARVRRAVILYAHHGFDNGAALNFMIVLAYNRFLGADIQSRKHLGKGIS